MFGKRIYIFLSVSLFSVFVLAQEPLMPVDPLLIRLKAKVVSAADSIGIPYANIVNHRTHSGTITNSEGFFTLEMLNIDSLVITSIGYQKGILKVPYNYSEYDVLTYVMKPVNYALQEVQVEGEAPKVNLGFETGKPVNIAPELRGDAFNEAPPIIAAFFNPVSFWQYYLSKREKQKRAVRREMAIQKNWEMHSQNYNKEMVMNLTGLNELQADTFMIWFNSQDVLPYTATEYQVRASIIQFFMLYSLEKTSNTSY